MNISLNLINCLRFHGLTITKKENATMRALKSNRFACLVFGIIELILLNFCSPYVNYHLNGRYISNYTVCASTFNHNFFLNCESINCKGSAEVECLLRGNFIEP